MFSFEILMFNVLLNFIDELLFFCAFEYEGDLNIQFTHFAHLKTA